jgi:hypothetical protein
MYECNSVAGCSSIALPLLLTRIITSRMFTCTLINATHYHTLQLQEVLMTHLQTIGSCEVLGRYTVQL